MPGVSVSGKPSNIKEKVFSSEIEVLKQKEFEKRRKLRLLQVREQSNEIAKSVRERAQRERLKQLERLAESKKDKLTKSKNKTLNGLIQICCENVDALGTAHRNAELTVQQERDQNKENEHNINAKIRGQKAAVALKEKKQEHLDKQKRHLDQKLIARLVANERGRQVLTTLPEEPEPESSKEKIEDIGKQIKDSRCSDTEKELKTCYELPIIDPIEAAVTQKSLVQDNKESMSGERATPKDLFAISEDMPSPLIGSRDRYPRTDNPTPALSVVSNFLDTRRERVDVKSKHKKYPNKERNSTIDTDSRAPLSSKPSNRPTELLVQYDHRDKSLLSLQKPKSNVTKEDQSGMNAYQLATKELEEAVTQDNTLAERKRIARGREAASKDRMVEQCKGTLKDLQNFTNTKCKEKQNSYMSDFRKLMKNLDEQKKLKEELEEAENALKDLPWMNKVSHVLPKESLPKQKSSTTSTEIESYSDDVNEDFLARNVYSISDAESLLNFLKSKVRLNVKSSKHSSEGRKKSTRNINENVKSAKRVRSKKTVTGSSGLWKIERHPPPINDESCTIDQRKIEGKSAQACANCAGNAPPENDFELKQRREEKYVDHSTQMQPSPKSSVASFKTSVPKTTSASESTTTLTENNAWQLNVASDGDRKSTDKDSLKGNRDKKEEAQNLNDLDLNTGGYIKVLDESGQEAGKFYFGSCKPLKENGFEIVIQLKRRTEDEKGDNNPREKESVNKEVFVKRDETSALSSPDYCNSTSTVYYSPPEAILPKFLKHGYTITKDELTKATSRKEVPLYQRLYEYDAVLAPRNEYLAPIAKPKSPILKRRSKSTASYVDNSEMKRVDSPKKKQGSISDRGDSVIADVPQVNKKSKSINPILKKYIHELLEMSKDEVKELPVSAVTSICTPGSSVTNMPSNNKKTIKNNLVQNLLHSVGDSYSDSFDVKSFSVKKTVSGNNLRPCSSSKTVPRNDKRKSKNNKRSRLCKHKIKSVNISKNINKYLRVNFAQVEQQKSLYYLASSNINSGASLKSPSKANEGKIKSRKGNTLEKDKRDIVTSNIRKPVKYIKEEIELKKSKSSPQMISVNKQEKPKTPENFKQNIIVEKKQSDGNSGINKIEASQTAQKENIKSHIKKGEEQERSNKDKTEYNEALIKDIFNTEKLSDMTEKCSKRLSNLVKVLDEVRKNKSDLYAQLSSDSLSSPDKSKPRENENFRKKTISGLLRGQPVQTDFVPLLGDIPKPFETKNNDDEPHHHIESETNSKGKGKPPPALKRALVDGVAHELSTVVEVDTPKSTNSMKNSLKSTPPKYSMNNSIDDLVTDDKYKPDLKTEETSKKVEEIKTESNILCHQPLDDLPVMNIDEFNELMLKPFKTFEEYVKQRNLSVPTDVSKLDELIPQLKSPHVLQDDACSSDGTLPDIVAELLKRNVIKEPFNFEDQKNHTSLSSDSSSSLLLLEKIRQKMKKKSVKSNVNSDESKKKSSDSDLDEALCKLGMYWASSTLKKTKEAFNLPSSTSTSISSSTKDGGKLPRKSNLFRKIKLISDSSDNFNLETSSLSSTSVTSGKHSKQSIQQQTSEHFLTQNLSVMGFLTNELANKITFADTREETNEHFTTLHTTNPIQDTLNDKSKNSTAVEENLKSKSESGDEVINKRRTSTPVQLFRASNYNSSTSSVNNSNSLFSNVDDLSSVKGNSKNHSSSDKDDLIIPKNNLDIKKFLKTHNKTS